MGSFRCSDLEAAGDGRQYADGDPLAVLKLLLETLFFNQFWSVQRFGRMGIDAHFLYISVKAPALRAAGFHRSAERVPFRGRSPRKFCAKSTIHILPLP